VDKSIHVSTSGRIQIALIDLHGAHSGRVDGSAGFAIEEPAIRLVVKESAGDEILVTQGDEGSSEIATDIAKALTKIRAQYVLGGAHVSVESMLLPHAGFGSKTQALLAASAAHCRLYGCDYRVRDLADALGRGGTSGIGVQTFETGGFVVDAGHSFKSKKYTFSPSSASTFASPPPIVGRYEFPDWPVLIVTPNERRQFFKSEELGHWAKNTPIPLADAQACCQAVLMMLIPAVLESDVETFCLGINYIQELAWKKSLRQAQVPVVAEMMQFLRERGVAGVGLSSAGATVYALGPALNDTVRAKQILDDARRFLDARGGGSCFITRGSNRGAVFS
jgi:beta-ribofuranosylaminobenzene 5'-phosphate synthase